MKVKTIRLYKDNEEVIVDEKRVREFSELGYQPEPVGERGESSDVGESGKGDGESGKGDGGKAKGRKAKDAPAPQDADAAGGA